MKIREIRKIADAETKAAPPGCNAAAGDLDKPPC